MRAGASFRGQPLLVLLVLLGGWVGLRMVLWQPPFAIEASVAPGAADIRHAAAPARRSGLRASGALLPPRAPLPPHLRFGPAPAPPPAWPTEPLPASAPAQQAGGAPKRLSPMVAAGEQVMLLEAFSRVPIPEDLAFLFEPARPAPAAGSPVQPPVRTLAGRGASHWSADGWLLLRRDTTTPVTSGRGSYGRSQMGAVIHYRLFAGDPFHSTVYLRASHALAGEQETEVAAGSAARPLPRVPVAAAVEIRLTETGGEVHERTAAYAVTELPPLVLPGGFTGEAYAQGGYVWGDFTTPFVDGQLRGERRLARLGNGSLSAGGAFGAGHRRGPHG